MPLQPSKPESINDSIAGWEEISKLQPVRNIYDLAWLAFARHEIEGNEAGRLDLIDISKHQEVLASSFLYDYSNAVGVMLSLYVASECGLPWASQSTVESVLDAVERWHWHDYTGEVIFAYVLLSKKYRIKEENVLQVLDSCERRCSDTLIDYNSFLRDGRDVAYMLLALDHAGGARVEKAFDLIVKSKGIRERLVDSPSVPLEVLVSWLWAYSVTANTSRERYEVLRDDINSIVQKVGERQKELVGMALDFGLMHDLAELIALAREGLHGRLRAKFGGLIKSSSDQEVTLDLRSLNVGRPRISLYAKVQLALFGSGFLKPYALSSKERDLYLKVKAGERGGFRFVRSYELATYLLLVGGIVLAASYSYIRPLLGAEYGFLASLPVVAYADVAWGVWREGCVTPKSLTRAAVDLGDGVKKILGM